MNKPQVAQKVERQAMALELKFHKPGNKKQISNDVIKDAIEEAESDAESLHLSKDMLRSDEYQAIRSHDRATKKHLRRTCLPSLTRESIYMIPLEALETTDTFVTKAQLEREALVEKFIAVYPDRVQEAKKRLGPKVFDAADYPPASRVKASFWVEARYRNSFDVPKALESINQEIFKREQLRAQKDWQAMLEETKKYLRVNMVEFVTRFAQSLEVKSDGTKRKVYDSTVENLNQFLELFKIRDISNDSELQSVVAKVQGLMKGVSPDAIRDGDDFRQKLAHQFKAVTEKLGTMIEDAPILRKVLKKK